MLLIVERESKVGQSGCCEVMARASAGREGEGEMLSLGVVLAATPRPSSAAAFAVVAQTVAIT